MQKWPPPHGAHRGVERRQALLEHHDRSKLQEGIEHPMSTCQWHLPGQALARALAQEHSVNLVVGVFFKTTLDKAVA